MGGVEWGRCQVRVVGKRIESAHGVSTGLTISLKLTITDPNKRLDVVRADLYSLGEVGGRVVLVEREV